MSGDHIPTASRAVIWTDIDNVDESLLRRVRDDDCHDAFAELLPRLERAIDQPLVRYLPPTEIDDGRSEVALRIWMRRKQYRKDRGTPRMWVRGISRFYAWDWLRKDARAPRVFLDLDNLLVTDDHPCPARAVEEAEWASRLECRYREALAGFPPHARTSFELRLQGDSYASIALATGRPIGTIASEVFRVRARLLTLIQDIDRPRLQREGNAMSKESPIATVRNDISEIQDRLTALEQEVRLPADTPEARAMRLHVRLRLLIADPTQRQSDTDWAEVEDLVHSDDGLRPVTQQLPRGLFTKVSARLQESRELLRRNPEHGAAINQLREVETLLVGVTCRGSA